MSDTVRRLIKLGYGEEQAWGLYQMYTSNNDLDGLESFIASREGEDL